VFKEDDTSGSIVFYPSSDYGLIVIVGVLALLGMLLAFRLRRGRKVEARRRAEQYITLLAEAIPQIVWTATPAGAMDYCNQRLYDLTGYSREESLGWAWQKLLHPDDLPFVLRNWESSRQTGTAYEVEYRLRTAAGDYRWHLVRATPMRDSSGSIVKWFGACTDINDQMHQQQLLEEQVRQHMAALMEANSRLSSEMRERALAQQELNAQSERTVQELTRRSNRATALIKMAELLQSCASVNDAFSVIAGMAPKVFPELRGALLLFNPLRELLDIAALWSDCDLPARGIGMPDCWALRSGRLHTVTAGDCTAICGHAANCPYSYLCLPLQSHGETIGLLHFQMMQAGELPQAILLSANMFAEQVSLSLTNIQLREALRSESIRDPLTGLYNRRFLEETLERETRRAIRAEQGLGVLMLDLDHFKKFNDTYGHDAGDTVLRETAAFLLKSVRAEDIVCRFGGEEFIVILPMADFKTTHARAERIRSKLRELTILHRDQSLGIVTVSIGVAEAPLHGTCPKDLIDAADAALYRAKREGRDRVAVAAIMVAPELQLNPLAVGKS